MTTQFYHIKIQLGNWRNQKNKGKTRVRKLPLTVFLIALIGVTLSMWGASWDITSHLLRTPETFFTPSHTVLYLGVGISLISAILSLAIFATKRQVRKGILRLWYENNYCGGNAANNCRSWRFLLA